MSAGRGLLRLTEEHERLVAEVRDFAEAEVAPRAATIDREERTPPELVQALAGAGLLGTRISPSHGGRGLDAVAYGLVHRELGRECASTRSLLTVHDMVAEAISRLGGPALKQRLLPRLAAGETVAAFALSEPRAGSDAAAIETTATETQDGFALRGTKRWISYGQIADLFLVLARVGDDGPIAGFLVPRDAEGFHAEPIRGLLGLRGAMLAELRLEGCLVPRDARVGSARMPDGLVAATTLTLGRLGVAWGCVGMAASCLAQATAYAAEREQFGVPIGDHQLVRRMVTDMEATVRAASLLCMDASVALDAREPDAGTAVLLAKYVASRAATSVTATALHLHGAVGFTDARSIERHFRDAPAMEVIEGSSEIQQLLIGGQLLKAARSAGGSRER